MTDSLRPHESQHARPPCPSPTPGIHSNSCPSSWWCYPAISSFVIPFSSCSQSLPASESLPVSQLFTWDGQSTGVSASASFLPKKFQGWFPSEWTGWISLQSKGLSRVFSNTTVQKHQFFGVQGTNTWESLRFGVWVSAVLESDLWLCVELLYSLSRMHHSSLSLALWMYLSLFNHFLTSEYLGCFQSLAITNHCRWWLQPWN